MTDHTTAGGPTAHDLLVLADPVPTPPALDAETVARVVRVARAAGDAAPPVRARRSRRRLVVGIGAVAVAAAAASVAVGVLPQGERLGVRPPAAAADPAVVLRAAAATAAAAPFTVPRPDQFLYVHGRSGRYQAWLSMDGTHDGLIRSNTGEGPGGDAVPGCRAGVRTATGQDGRVHVDPCVADPAYRPDVPTDPTALRSWLVTAAGSTATNDVAKQVLAVLEFDYLTPGARAALFTVLAGYDGLSTTTAGVPADTVGVSWDFGGGSTTLVFTAGDHRWLGTLQPGYGLVSTATAVVDAVGQTG